MPSNNAIHKDSLVNPNAKTEAWVNLATNPATNPQDFLAEEEEVIETLATPENDVSAQHAEEKQQR